MPRNISAGFETNLASGTLKVALLILVEREDAVVQAFTTWDRSIEYLTETFSPLDGVTASALNNELGTGVDPLSLNGLLQDSRINSEDLRAGLYKGARVTMFQVFPDDLASGHMIVFYGYVGTSSMIFPGRYSAEVPSLSKHLKQSRGVITSKTCRCKRLGDAECKADLSAVQFTRTVFSVNGAYEIVFSGESAVSGYFEAGIITGVTGANAGFEKEAKTHVKVGTTAVITLREAFPYQINPGDTFQLEKGCNRTWQVCGTFVEQGTGVNNIINFHGEPAIPGNSQMKKVGDLGKRR
jgi:uncharacterized phage protein (TIGR02218 family)